MRIKFGEGEQRAEPPQHRGPPCQLQTLLPPLGCMGLSEYSVGESKASALGEAWLRDAPKHRESSATERSAPTACQRVPFPAHAAP